MGSGSTGKAALGAGFRFVGIEREAEYFQIAVARIENGRPVANIDLEKDRDLPLFATGRIAA